MKRGSKNDPLDAFEMARHDLARRAAAISDLMLDAAVQKLDALFGEGFARANPDLLGSYLVATARTFQNDILTAAEYGEDLELDLPPPDLDRRR